MRGRGWTTDALEDAIFELDRLRRGQWSVMDMAGYNLLERMIRLLKQQLAKELGK